MPKYLVLKPTNLAYEDGKKRHMPGEILTDPLRADLLERRGYVRSLETPGEEASPTEPEPAIVPEPKAPKSKAKAPKIIDLSEVEAEEAPSGEEGEEVKADGE